MLLVKFVWQVLHSGCATLSNQIFPNWSLSLDRQTHLQDCWYLVLYKSMSKIPMNVRENNTEKRKGERRNIIFPFSLAIIRDVVCSIYAILSHITTKIT